MTGPGAGYRIAVDVGGTFTDMVLVDADGCFHVFKTPSVPADPSRGVLDVLEHAARSFRIDVESLLSSCGMFLHGSTVATNTVLEGSGSCVGMLVTRGFRDFLEARRGFRADPFDHRAPYPPVLVPRYLRLPVGGRMDARGAEIEPLDEADLDIAIETFRAERVESIAVCLLHSFENGAHERRCAEVLHERGGFEWVSLSHDVVPVIGEYERGSTTVVNACIGPRVVRYLQSLDERLRAMGLGPDLLVLQSNGRAISIRQVAHCPVNLVLSGPAGGVGALDYLAAATGIQDLITMEIGGTSCDVMLRAGGRVAVTDRLEVGGYDLVSASVDIHTVGAGGGTVAGADAAGLLYAGPRGAGAIPGPAAYGRGGKEPTVTDAQLVLGRLAPGPYAGGAVSLDRDRAEDALRTCVGEPLGLSVEEAAIGVIRLVEQNLLQAVEQISTERGRDPARFVLVACGGAGPMHGAAVGRRLGTRGVLVPRLAGVFCALGMLNADVGQDFARVFIMPLDEAAANEARSLYADLEHDARAWLREGGFDPGAMRLEHEADLRYAGQQWDVRVAEARVGVAELRSAFEREHDRLFGHVQPDSTVELTKLRVVGIGTLPPLEPARAEPSDTQPEPTSTRAVYAFGPRGEPLGFEATAVYRGADLLPGHRLEGPLLVEEQTTTVVVGPRDRLEVLTSGDLLIPSRLRQSGSMTLDPVQLALTQNRLDYITRQMGDVMVRTARSPIFSQAHDFTCFVCGPHGWLVSQADGIPIHSGGGGFAVRAVLRDFEGDIEPGDAFVLNDPWLAGGNHLPDWVIARPVFVDDRRVAFACNRAHQSDIGGGAPGTYNPLARDTWQEGVRIPAMKLVSRGETRQDLWRMLLANSRTPELQDGDLRAMLGATRIGAERVADFAEEVSVDRALALFDGILDHAELRMRAALAALPDGVYEGADHSDNDCFEPCDVAVRARLTIEGDRARVDLSGSSPQIRGFKNSTWANTCSSVYTAFASFFEPDIPRNEGTFRAIELIAPEGSIVNATEGAATTMCTVFVAHEIIHACWKALGVASPERACAGWAKNVFGITTGRHGDGRRYVLYHGLAAAGAGAVDGRDGFNQIGHLCTLGGLVMPSLEVYEQLYPVRYRRCEFRCDAGGPGAWRGGTGVEYEIDVHTEGTWSFRGEGLRYRSGYGAASGQYGEGGEMHVHPTDAPAFEAPKFGLRELGPARLVVSSPGGGGFGDPLDRDVDRVLRDVRDGVVSIEAAREHYGVVLTGGGRRVDPEATARQRATKRGMHAADGDSD